ncbi:methyl-accepting chemotaxis sensory transducer with phytochrome sensor [Scytonema sp. HK-05]|uniref:MHYT domain-containing protein n=1 Tax=Scytonema sp. HK-05 TaxID=1137095 RepID=UPI000937DAB7|nr:MHYT domain-containing protein [Scytonema sp. HK-05]OKH56725.1 PAS domain S-box protein [Scytonema sp. HK-05]BAY49214.1 methyl-accepting chemotaxis sensory transducer with phytochrome sensor [Scytonema sp. HK-05]
MLLADVAMSSTYDPRLVALSIVIAVLASYTAVDLAGRVTAAQGRARLAWLIGGAIAMGMGIWSMHFVAMLAYSFPIPMSYDVWIVLLSILPAIIASLGALFLASRQFLSQRRLLIGGVLMGIGIASMHYIGMLAMRMQAATQYQPVLFILSIVIAISASILALWIAFHLRLQIGKGSIRRKILSALVMGAGISGMHYTGMAAASFTPTQVRGAGTAAQEMQASFTWLAVGIGIATLIILSCTLLTAFVDRRIVTQAMLLKQQQAEAERSQLFTEVTLRIRRSLKLEDVLNTAVTEVRKALNLDRVIVYYFNRDWSGTIIAESVAQGWMKTLGKTVDDPFREDYIEMYKNGRVRATNNIYEAGFTDCHQKILEGFQIKANIVAPLLQDNELLGLLCGHQCCGPRIWQKSEIDLFGQLAIQVSIALEQANLLHQLQQAQKVLRVRDLAIAAASNSIIITDPHQPDNPIVFCNAAFETVTGYSPKEVQGRNCRFLQGPDTDPDTIEEIRTAVQQERECHVIIKNYRKDGTAFWCELSISTVRDVTGNVINFVGVQSDITSRKQAEEELKRSKETLQRQLVELISEVQEVAKGDLTARAEITTGQIGIVADFFNVIIESLRQIVIQVKQAAQQVNVSVGENSHAISQLADEALNQAEEITRTIDSVDQMSLSIQEVANSAHQTAEVARASASTALVAGEVMELTVSSILNLQKTITETAEKIKRFGESSQEISKVVTLINQIALQTNLLSINASIEASRAGEENQGFIVVAQEVGRLAAESAEATKEIEYIVQNIQSETNAVVEVIEQGTTQVVESAYLVKDVKQSMERIVEVSRQIDELVESISLTTVSHAQTSQAVSLLMKEITKASVRTADSSRVVSTSLQQTVEVAQQLQASVSVFKTEV